MIWKTGENLTETETTESQPKRWNAKLKEWGAKLDELVAEAEKSDTEAKTDHRKPVYNLKAKYQVVQANLDSFRTADSKKWKILKAACARRQPARANSACANSRRTPSCPSRE